MSLITCCPACGTMFKVVPDQLRISQGWVRCGHCADVFDATAHLQDRQPVMPQPPTRIDVPLSEEELLPAGEAAPEPPHPEITPQRSGSENDGDADAEQAQKDKARREKEAVEQALLAEALAFAEAARSSGALSTEQALYPPFKLLRADDEPPASQPASIDPQPEAGAVPDAAPEGPAAPDLGPAELSFVRDARRKAFWRRPAVRVLMGCAVLALGGLLAAQWALHDRDRLAQRYPALQGLLGLLCRPSQCTLSAPRQIDAITIDSSSFNKLRSDAYRLSLTLKNQANVAVAMPSLELTLTDSQDQPVIRRVLAPGELGNNPVIPAASEWSGTLALGVAANGAAARVAGYRLLAFYP
jgi:predicted Zn finger-like uncharacterized protein